VTDRGGADSVLRFWLVRGGDGMKCYRKMKCISGLVLAQWEGNVTRHGGMVTSTGGEAAAGREKGGNDVNWADVNLTVPKNKENLHGQFSCYK
jgi:hypothetical protein